MKNQNANDFEAHRLELTAYLTRLVTRLDIAEELSQQTALRMLESKRLPGSRRAFRAWLYRIATNLAIDHLRRHHTWRESILAEAQANAEENEAFLERSSQWAGSPEMKNIAREHLIVCFSCTLRNLPALQSAALLLREVYGFTVEETAAVMDASFAQVKGRIQSARAAIKKRYAESCALVRQQGVCYQCVELDDFFNGKGRNPLEATPGDLDSRLGILKANRTATLGPWHKMMMQLIDEILR